MNVIDNIFKLIESTFLLDLSLDIFGGFDMMIIALHAHFNIAHNRKVTRAYPSTAQRPRRLIGLSTHGPTNADGFQRFMEMMVNVSTNTVTPIVFEWVKQ